MDIESRKAYDRQWYAKNRDKCVKSRYDTRKRHKNWFNDLKSKLKCKICQENHPACLQFHHKDPSIKIDSVCMMVMRGFSKDKVLKEIEKCDVLCSNCHFKTHWTH